MIKLIIIISFLTTLVSFGQKQNFRVNSATEFKQYVIEYKTVVFSTKDSNYLITQYNYPGGSYEFRSGAANQNREKDSLFSFGGFVQTFKFLDQIDTIINCIPFQNTIEQKLIKGVIYSASDLLDAVKFSYILNTAKLSKLTVGDTNIIRIIDPIKISSSDIWIEPDSMQNDLMQAIGSAKDYNIYELRLNKDFAILYLFSTISENTAGLRLAKKGSVIISPKKHRQIEKDLAKLDFTKRISCRNPGEAFLVECNYNKLYYQFVLTALCRGKEIKFYKRLYYSISSIYRD